MGPRTTKTKPQQPIKARGKAKTLAVERTKDLPKLAGLGMNLRRARERAGYTLEVAGKKIGVSERTMGRYEHGRFEPCAKRMVMLADLYNTTTDALYGRVARAA